MGGDVLESPPSVGNFRNVRVFLLCVFSRGLFLEERFLKERLFSLLLLFAV